MLSCRQPAWHSPATCLCSRAWLQPHRTGSSTAACLVSGARLCWRSSSVCTLGAQADGVSTALLLLLLLHTAMAQHARCCTQPWHAMHTAAYSYSTAGLAGCAGGVVNHPGDPAPARAPWQWLCPCTLLLHSATFPVPPRPQLWPCSAPCSTALLTFLGPRFPHSITAAVLIVGATRLYATEDA